MDDARDGKSAAIIVLGLIQMRVTAQDKGRAGSEGAYGSSTDMLFFFYLQRFQLVVGDALSLSTVGIAISPGRVATIWPGQLLSLPALASTGRVLHRPIVPALHAGRAGDGTRCDAPAVDAIFPHDSTRLGKANFRLCVRLEGAVVVRDD